MITEIFNRHKDASFAVVGSAPSATMFKHEEDIIIGVNGAARLLQSGDYFYSGHESAHEKPFYKHVPEGVTHMLRAVSAIYSPMFFPNKRQRQKIIQGWEQFMEDHYDQTAQPADGSKTRVIDVSAHPGLTEEYMKNVPNPAAPHIFFRSANITEQIGRNQRALRMGGTSAGAAAQIAFLMGAKEIHLYGVEFSNDVETKYGGTNYFFKAEQDEQGMTLESQRMSMDQMLSEINNLGTEVYAHGPTGLEEPLRG